MLSRLLFIFTAIFVALAGCNAKSASSGRISYANIGAVQVLDVSDDGHWAISTHDSRHAILWNIEQKTYRLVSADANIFSAGFIPNSHQYIWQDLNGRVHVADINGKEVRRFRNFPVYGHALTAAGQYVSVNDDYGIFTGIGEAQKKLKAEGGSYQGFGKLLNLSFSPDGKRMVTSGFGSPYDAEWESIQEQGEIGYKNLVGVVLWDLVSAKPIAKLPGNIAKTYATFSPDGKYVVSGDENGIVVVFDVSKKKKKFQLGSLFHGIYIGEGKDLTGLDPKTRAKEAWDSTGLITAPDDYIGQEVLSLKFIDLDNHYLRITANQHYAILYSIDNPLPLKYLDLGTDPYPATREHARNTAIDSAPAAGILVTGQANGPGINVYRYDKTTRTLKRIWVAR